jgi:type IV pilus assembly protein PilC
VKGKLEAKNEEQASELLSFACYQVINLREQAAFPLLEQISLKLNPLKPGDIILFYRQVALLIESGVNIVNAIELLEAQTTNRIFKRTLKEVVADIRSGSQLSVALSKHPTVFSPIDCQSLKVGEQTGGLEVILRQVAEHLEKKATSGKGVKNALTYPILALVVSIIVVGIMVVFVLPTFSRLYVSLNVPMPLITKIMLSAGEFLLAYGVYILGVLFIGTVVGLLYMRTAAGKYKFDQISLKAPMVGRINHLNELAHFARSVSVMFKAGSSLTEIMPLVIQSSRNKVMAETLMSIRNDMLGGEGLSRPMSKHTIFLPMLVQMVKVGEETGNLDATLMSVAQSYEAEAEDKTKVLISMIQPIMTVVIGLVVGAVALSLVSAMYSLYQGGI